MNNLENKSYIIYYNHNYHIMINNKIKFVSKEKHRNIRIKNENLREKIDYLIDRYQGYFIERDIGQFKTLFIENDYLEEMESLDIDKEIEYDNVNISMNEGSEYIFIKIQKM